jgi:hypothetical protein
VKRVDLRFSLGAGCEIPKSKILFCTAENRKREGVGLTRSPARNERANRRIELVLAFAVDVLDSVVLESHPNYLEVRTYSKNISLGSKNSHP